METGGRPTCAESKAWRHTQSIGRRRGRSQWVGNLFAALAPVAQVAGLRLRWGPLIVYACERIGARKVWRAGGRARKRASERASERVGVWSEEAGAQLSRGGRKRSRLAVKRGLGVLARQVVAHSGARGPNLGQKSSRGAGMRRAPCQPAGRSHNRSIARSLGRFIERALDSASTTGAGLIFGPERAERN